MTANNVNGESKRFSAAIRPNSGLIDGQIAQHAGRMGAVPDAGEPLSPQAAELVRRIARVFLDEPAVRRASHEPVHRPARHGQTRLQCPGQQESPPRMTLEGTL